MPALLIFQTSPGGWASPVWIRKSNEVPKPRTTLGCQAVNSAGLQESPRFGGKTWPKAMDFLKKPGNHSIFSEISQDVGEINKENKLEIDGQKGFLMRRYATARASKADFLLKRLNPADRIHSTSHRRRYYFTAVDIWAWGCIVGEMHLGVSHCLSLDPSRSGMTS